MNNYKVVNCLATIISDLKDDNKALNDMIHTINMNRNENSNKIAELQDVVKDLQAEAIEQIKENKKLQDKLQEVNNDYNNDTKVHNEYEDGLLAEIKELKAENCNLINESKWDKNKLIKELQAENESLQDQLKDAVNDYESLLNSNGVK